MARRKWHITAFRLAALGGFIILLDYGLFRYPYIYLTGGYEITPPTVRKPCELRHNPHRDPRSYSEWHASRSDWNGRTKWRLSKRGELLEFDSEQEWRLARKEKNARPEWSFGVHEVTAFDHDGRFIIGEHGGGYFLVDACEHLVQTFVDRDVWVQAVTARTSLETAELLDPSDRHVWTRGWATYCTYLGIALVALPWALVPLRRDGSAERRRRKLRPALRAAVITCMTVSVVTCLAAALVTLDKPLPRSSPICYYKPLYRAEHGERCLCDAPLVVDCAGGSLWVRLARTVDAGSGTKASLNLGVVRLRSDTTLSNDKERSVSIWEQLRRQLAGPQQPASPAKSARLTTTIYVPLWGPTLVLGVYPAIAFIRGPVRRWRRRKHGLCIHCGYNLTGLTEPRCPECGERI